MIDFEKDLKEFQKIIVKIVLILIVLITLIFGLLYYVIKEEITSRDERIWQLEVENQDLKEQIYRLERE